MSTQLTMKLLPLFYLLALCMPILAQPQGAGIGTSDPDPSAILHVKESNNKGVLIPRTTPAQISAPSDGLIIYNASTGNLSYSNNGAWTDIVPIPSGTIIMWSGDISSLPDGWVFCNGQSYNLQGQPGGGISTPDLRGYFVSGYSGSGEYASVGASSIGEAAHTLSTAEIPAHSHTIASDHRHSTAVSSASHTHDFSVDDAIKGDGVIPGAGGSTFPGYYYNTVGGAKSTDAVSTTINVGSSTTGVIVGSTGSGVAHENRPPFYTLAFIMKL